MTDELLEVEPSTLKTKAMRISMEVRFQSEEALEGALRQTLQELLLRIAEALSMHPIRDI